MSEVTAVQEDAPGAPEKRGRRLGTLSNVKAALADVYRKQEDGEVNANEARARVYTLAEIAKILQGWELERRLEKLEGAAQASSLRAVR